MADDPEQNDEKKHEGSGGWSSLLEVLLYIPELLLNVIGGILRLIAAAAAFVLESCS